MCSNSKEFFRSWSFQILGRKRIITGIFVISFCSLLIWSVSSYIFARNKPDHGTMKSVCYNENDMKAWINKNYTGNVTAKCSYLNKLSSLNVSQDELKEFYNKIHNSNPISDNSGICWAAAQTSVLKYAGVSSSVKNIGRNVIEKAMSKRWVSTSDTGFNFTHSDTLMNAMFDYFSVKKEANNDRYDIYTALKSEIDNGRVVIFKIKEHEMTGCGYREYTVNYQSKNIFGNWKNKKDICKFIIVNTTWGDTTDYSYAYFPEGEIGTNITTRWDFGITKYEKK